MKTGPSIGNILDTAHQHQGGSTQSATRLWLWLVMAAFVLTCGLTAVSQQTIQYTDGYQRTLNVTACGYGFGQCNQGLLSPAEVAQVIAIRHQQNVTACGYGFGQCNQGLLTPAEVVQVMAIRHQQNVTACGYGFGQCNQGLLAPAEVAQVMAIRRRQIIAACEYGAGLCKQTRLTPSDSAVVRSAASADQCLASSYLPPSIVETSTAAPTSLDTELNTLFKALLTSVGTPVAENGSYYGEPNKNGVPKTVLVNGYTRSNGTYVQGYYRSAPGTNPIR
jgi:hypothetical protein